MIRAAAFALALALGLGAALALASCGGGEDAKLLPGKTAAEINENLAQVRQLAAEGECVDAEDAALQVSSQVEQLGGIDAKLKQALEQGADRLNEVVLSCAEETTEASEEDTTATTETTEAEPEQEKKQEKEEEKREKEEEKQLEKEEKEAEEEQKAEEGPPFGEAKGHDEHGPPVAPPAPPSGGIGPGGEAGEGGD